MITTIIITYNRLKLTKQCVESYYDTVPNKGHRLLIVDNQSTDGTQEWLKEQEISHIINPQNYYLGKAWNIGFESIDYHNNWTGKIDNDAVFHQGWAENLYTVIRTVQPKAVIITERPNRTKQYGIEIDGVKFQQYPNDVGGFYYMEDKFLKQHNIRMVEKNKMDMSNNGTILGEIRKRHGKVVRLEAPGCVIKEQYTDPDHLEYYEETFGQRNLIKELRKRQARERK